MTAAVALDGQKPDAKRRGRGEEGLAEFVVCFPVFFLLVIGGIQFALWSHASHLARAAAEQGSQAASAYGSTQSTGTQAAYRFIDTTGPGRLTLTVSATSDAPIQEYRSSG